MTSQGTNKINHEVRAHTVRMVLDHESEPLSRWGATVTSLRDSTKFGRRSVVPICRFGAIGSIASDALLPPAIGTARARARV